MSLLNITCMINEHAVIGSTIVTLNSGSVLLTFYPNFNMPLRDPNLSSAFQIQIQIEGAPHIGTAFAGTIHHQLIYRVQDHAVNLCLLVQEASLVFVIADQPHIPSIVQFPPTISHEELLKRMPTNWITNFEKLQERIHKPPVTFHAHVTNFTSLSDGSVKASYQIPENTESSSSSGTLPFSQSMAIFPI